VRLEHVELQLRPGQRRDAQPAEPLDGAPQHGSRALLGGRTVRVVQVRDAVRHALLPRQPAQRVEVRDGQDVRKAVGEAALDVDDVAHRGGPVDGPAERHAAAGRACEPVDEEVAAALGADEVGVAEADDVDALPGELLLRLFQPVPVDVHSLPSGRKSLGSEQ
jgi:hypothetical protein